MKDSRNYRAAYPIVRVLFILMLVLPLTGSVATGSAQPAVQDTVQAAQDTLVLRVYFRDMAERDRLAAELNPLEVGTEGGYLTLWADGETYSSLVSRGLRVEIERRVDGNPLRASAALQQAAGTFYGGYRTVEGIEAFLDAQVAAHPTLVEKVDFGDSWCKTHAGACLFPEPYDGYDLWALHITNRAIPGPKPVFWYDAATHPEEIATSEVALRFISSLLDGYDTNADARWLVDYQDIWVVPVLNPDGHHISEAGETEPYLQRKNADNDDGCSINPPDAEAGATGVDLNRNYLFKWACCGGSSSDPCSHVYRGPQPGSEEETQALMAMLRKLIPDQRGPGDNDAAPLTTMGVVQSMHAFASVNIYPWGWSSSPAPNDTDLSNIGAHMSATEVGGNGYKRCASAAFNCLYRTDGNNKDWVYGELGAVGVTTELEGDTFYPPYAEVEELWNKNRGMLTYLAKIARTPYLLTRGPDANTLLVEPQVVSAGTRPRLSAVINYDWTSNIYRQPVGAAEYYIDTPPWAGGTPRPMSPGDGSLNGETEAVVAEIDTSGLAPGRHIVFVRGRGTNVYEGNQSWGPVSAVFIDVVASGGTPVAATSPTPAGTVTATSVATSTQMPPPSPLPGTTSRLFPETGKTVTGIFLDYWNRNGGLAQQGFPISEVMGEVSDLDGKAYTVQYFERAVFEYHPENAGTPYEVLLSQLGTFRYRQKYPQGAPNQVPNTGSGSVLFPETGRRVGGRFLDYWQRNGGLPQQGYPISDEFTEVSDLNGQPYTVQYFERAVFEYHPENAGTPYEVLLSQLGTFRYQGKYGQR